MSTEAKPPKQMVGGCCVCSDERGWPENPLVYCDGDSCSVAVHQACYGIMQVPTGSWFCRKCESQERSARVKCELCPQKEGALKRTDNGGWAHVVCALYIPEARFGNVSTMEPIVLRYVPADRFSKSCYICEQQGRREGGGGARGVVSGVGACMSCNRAGCRVAFHVTCAQSLGLLCEEQGNSSDNVKYCGYCAAHYKKPKKGEGESISAAAAAAAVAAARGSASPASADLRSPAIDGEAATYGRFKKVEGRNGPLMGLANGGSEANMMELADCAAEMKRYDDVACKDLTADINQPSPSCCAATVVPREATPFPSSSNGDVTPLVGQIMPDTQHSSCKDDTASIAITCDGDLPSVVDAVSFTSESKPVDPATKPAVTAKRPPGGSQQRRSGSSSQSTESPSGSKSKRQKLQRSALTSAAPSNATTSMPTANGPMTGSRALRLLGPALTSSGSTEEDARIQDCSLSPPQPHSMQQLLEKQFEQGSQFLMEQAQYFDIASLLGCLGQLQAENKQLEESVRVLTARREHLVSVNARLSLPLSTLVHMHGGGVAGEAAGNRRQTPLSPRGSMVSETMPAQQPSPASLTSAAVGTAQQHFAGLTRVGETAPAAASTDHHHQQFLFQQQQQQQQQFQLQHMMMMSQTPTVSASMTAGSGGGSAQTGMLPLALSAPSNPGIGGIVIVPTPHTALLGPSPGASMSMPASGGGSSSNMHSLHLLPAANAMAAAAASVQQHLSSAAMSGSGSAFSPAGMSKLLKGERKATS